MPRAPKLPLVDETIIDIDNVFKSVVDRNLLKQHQLDESKKYLDEKVREHVADVLLTIDLVYKQNYMRWSVYKECCDHPLYKDMLELLREKNYDVKITYEDAQLYQNNCTNYEWHTIGTLVVRWDTEAVPEPCMSDVSPDSIPVVVLNKCNELISRNARLLRSFIIGFLSGAIVYTVCQVSKIK